MTNQNRTNSNYDDLSFFRIWQTIKIKWRSILIISCMGGVVGYLIYFIKGPEYTATCKIQISSSVLEEIKDPSYLFLNEYTQDELASKFNYSDKDISEISILLAPKSKTIFEISTVDKDPDQVIESANFLCDNSIKWIDTYISKKQIYIEAEINKIEEVNREISVFLNKNKLTSLSWADLYYLSGIFPSAPIVCTPGVGPVYKLSTDQQIAISNLVMQKLLLEQNYQNTFIELSNIIRSNNTSAGVVNRATKAEEVTILRPMLSIPLGAICGFLFSIIIFVFKVPENNLTI